MKTRKKIAGTMLFIGFLFWLRIVSGVDTGTIPGDQIIPLAIAGGVLMLLGSLWLEAMERRENKK